MSEKFENNVWWSSIAELETVKQGLNPSLIPKLLLYTDPTVCLLYVIRLIFPIDTHTRTLLLAHTVRKEHLVQIHAQVNMAGSKHFLQKKKKLWLNARHPWYDPEPQLPNKKPLDFTTTSDIDSINTRLSYDINRVRNNANIV